MFTKNLSIENLQRGRKLRIPGAGKVAIFQRKWAQTTKPNERNTAEVISFDYPSKENTDVSKVVYYLDQEPVKVANQLTPTFVREITDYLSSYLRSNTAEGAEALSKDYRPTLNRDNF